MAEPGASRGPATNPRWNCPLSAPRIRGFRVPVFRPIRRAVLVLRVGAAAAQRAYAGLGRRHYVAKTTRGAAAAERIAIPDSGGLHPPTGLDGRCRWADILV